MNSFFAKGNPGWMHVSVLIKIIMQFNLSSQEYLCFSDKLWSQREHYMRITGLCSDVFREISWKEGEMQLAIPGNGNEAVGSWLRALKTLSVENGCLGWAKAGNQVWLEGRVWISFNAYLLLSLATLNGGLVRIGAGSCSHQTHNLKDRAEKKTGDYNKRGYSYHME